MTAGAKAASGLNSLAELSLRLRERGEAVALIFGGAEPRLFAAAELASRALSFAAALRSRGLERGDRTVIAAQNSPAWVASALGCLAAGGVVTPVDVQSDDANLRHIVADASPRLLLADQELAKRFHELDLHDPPEVLLLDEEEGDRSTPDDVCEVGPEEPAALFYTSGTTGQPKGVPLTHANLLFQIEALRSAELVRPRDRVFLPLPLHHVYPFVVGMLTPLALGAPLALPQATTGPELIQTLNASRATIFIGVPRLYEALVAALETRLAQQGLLTRAAVRRAWGLSASLRRRTRLPAGDLLLRSVRRQLGKHVRLAASGGSALDPEIAWKLEGLGWRVAIGYGLTETSPLLTLHPPGALRFETVGQAIPGVELRVEPVPDRHVGEVQARGPGVFHGYRNLPQETDEVFTPDGWFRTGDLGALDDGGWLRLAGRSSTLIITPAGKNIQPEEVEEAYQRSPRIREAGVLQRGKRLAAVITPAAGDISDLPILETTLREAVGEISRRLPSYKRLGEFQIYDRPLPRTRLGKIRRGELEELYERLASGREEEFHEPLRIDEMESRDRALLENPAARSLWDLLAERYASKGLTPDMNLQLGLGIDSLEWVSLTLALHDRGAALDEAAIGRAETVRDLLQEASRAQHSSVERLERPLERLSDEQKRLLEAPQPWSDWTFRAVFRPYRRMAQTLFDLRVDGLENLPEGRNYVIAANHLSYLDAFVLAAALGRERLRNVYWAGWVALTHSNPFTRLGSKLARVLPIDPDRGALSSLALAAAALERGGSLVWFPEGRLSRNGELLEFRPGLGLLLERQDPLVVPTAIEGTREALPPGSFRLRRHPVTVRFGPAVSTEELRGGEGGPDDMMRRLRQRIAELQNAPSQRKATQLGGSSRGRSED